MYRDITPPHRSNINHPDLLSNYGGIKKAVEFARQVQQMRRDDEAEAVWAQVYPELLEGKPGLYGAIISRAEAQVLRLSMIYALMDCSRIIQSEHLKAALALWDYSEKSVKQIFGQR